MSQRRMFSPQIVDSDAFLDMPASGQALYFHLGMRADDDGFVGNPRKILRMVGGAEDDMKILLAKRFILTFESGVIVIKHWKVNNLIRKDWYKETIYLEEKKQLSTKDNGSYTELVNETTPKIQRNVSVSVKSRPRRLGKVRLGKERIQEREAEPAAPTPSQEALNFFSKGENYLKTLEWLKGKGIEEKAILSELNKFIVYWTEKNKTGLKQRWEMERTFEVRGRLATWLTRVREFSNLGHKKFEDTQSVDKFPAK